MGPTPLHLLHSDHIEQHMQETAVEIRGIMQVGPLIHTKRAMPP